MIKDFRTYTEYDPGDNAEVSATKVTFTGLARNETAYVCQDKGAAHYSGDFEHMLAFRMTSATDTGFVAVWALANQAGDLQAIKNSGGGMLIVRIGMDSGGNKVLVLYEVHANTLYLDLVNISLDVPYWITVVRDESTGNGTLYCHVYTDAARTNLLDTLSLALHAKTDFRYQYALGSWNDGYLGEVTGYVENLDLGTVVIPAERRILIMDTSRRPLSFDTSRKDLVLDTKRRTLSA